MLTLNSINEYSNLIIALLAFLAFVISLLQAKNNRQHNRLCVKPALCDWLDVGNSYFHFSVTNNGIGPAIIKDMSVFVDDKKLMVERENLIPLAVGLLFNEYPTRVNSSHINNGYIVAVNEKIDIARVEFTSMHSPSPNEVKEKLKRVRVLIDYESAYEEAHQLDTKNNH